MSRRRLRRSLAGFGAAALALPAAAYAMGDMPGMQSSGPARAAHVSIEYIAYSPPQLDVLVGDTVDWSNDSSRQHTVTDSDGSWTSDHLLPGVHFVRTFDQAGAQKYFCQIHNIMQGEIDVHELLLDPPPASAAPDRSFPLTGRAALASGSTITIEGDSGAGFASVATGTVDDAGRFSIPVTPTTTTTYRAVSGDAKSPPVLLPVFDRTLSLRHVRRGGRDLITVNVTPASPGATVVLQLHLKERFGWWPERLRRLDRSSRATFSVSPTRPVSARVALTLPDGWTMLGFSPLVRIGPRPAAHRRHR